MNKKKNNKNKKKSPSKINNTNSVNNTKTNKEKSVTPKKAVTPEKTVSSKNVPKTNKNTVNSHKSKPAECAFNSRNNPLNKGSEKTLFNEKKSIKINTADVYGSNNINPKRNTNINNSSINFATNKNIGQVNNTNNGKEVSSGEAIDKMVSIGKNLFVNGSIVIGLSAVLVGGGIFFTGYDPIPLIEKNFIYKSNNNNALEENTIAKIPSLDISKDLPSEDVFSKYYDFVNIDLGDVILDENLFKQGNEAFNAQMSKFYSDSLIANLSANDTVYSTLNAIYDSENRYPYSISLTSIGKVIRNSKSVTKLSVDINAVDDDLGFHVWNLALFIDNNDKIIDVKVLAENKTLKNTRTPLSPSLSLITNGVKDSTYRSVNTFLKGITNEKLYNKIAASGKNFNNSQVKAFFSKLNIENVNYDVLGEMFEISKGDGSNFAVTEVISTDFDGEPITNIILSLKLDDYTYKYDLQYNRKDKVLVKISKL